jgi:hypothetical protein
MLEKIDLQVGEEIVAITRKHWFVFVVEAFALIIAAILPFLILPFLPAVFGIADVVDSADSLLIVVFFTAGWLLLLWVIFFVVWTDYYLDSLIITNKRIIDIDQLGLFNRDIASVPLENIQDVKIAILGFFPTFFGYGNVQVQSAGARREVIIRGVNNPEKVKQLINDAYNQYAGVGKI